MLVNSNRFLFLPSVQCGPCTCRTPLAAWDIDCSLKVKCKYTYTYLTVVPKDGRLYPRPQTQCSEPYPLPDYASMILPCGFDRSRTTSLRMEWTDSKQPSWPYLWMWDRSMLYSHAHFPQGKDCEPRLGLRGRWFPELQMNEQRHMTLKIRFIQGCCFVLSF